VQKFLISLSDSNETKYCNDFIVLKDLCPIILIKVIF